MYFKKFKHFRKAAFIVNFLSLTLIAVSQNTIGANYLPIVLDSTYHHIKWGIEPKDIIYEFAAYTSSFDGDDNGEIWGIPEWVAYEIKKKNGPDIPNYNRPKWMTDDHLNQLGKAPNDETYAVSGVQSLKEVSSTARFVRGHMCPKDTADRISMFAGFNTHTVLNAVPQLQWQNNGIWKKLENQSTKWADKYNQIWVVCGPIFFNKKPSIWLGQKGEVKAAIPDAIFKIIIRQNNNQIETLSFIIPNIIEDKKAEYYEYLTSMDRVESLTGLTFLTSLSSNSQNNIKAENTNLSKSKKKQTVNNW